jgi:hypothetical protein
MKTLNELYQEGGKKMCRKQSLQADAMQEVIEARVCAQAVECWIHFEEEHVKILHLV